MGVDLKNKKFLKEWDKIKDSDVFSSLESFAEFYYTNGEKPCFRINTNEPWSKDNFFFGEYSELLVYYKEEQPKKRIGQRFHSLTVLDVFWQEKDGKDTLFAKCKCDCGNEAIKTMYALTKGNARSCGCKKGGEAKKEHSVYELLSDIIDEYWDFEKNTVSPKDIPLDSEEEYWWKGYAHSYKMPIQYLLRSVSGTSFPEQAIRFFLSKNDIEVINRHLITFDGKKYELDLFLPKLNIGIEYDGVFWHASKTKKDVLKNNAVESTGITFVRVREKGLPKTKIKNGLEIMMQESVSNSSLANVINELFAYIESVAEIKLEKISPRDISKNKVLIQSQYSLSYVKNSVANSWLSEFWSEDNKEEPYFIPLKATASYSFRCSRGMTFHCPPYRLVDQANAMGEDPLSKCVFDYAHLCQQELRVHSGLTVIVSDVKFSPQNLLEIKFSIENRNDTAFDPLRLGQYSILQNKEVTSFEGKQGYIDRFALSSLEKSKNETCSPFYNSCFGKHNFELISFSKKTYNLRLNLEKTKEAAENIEILAVLNLVDQMNFVYKICVYVKRVDSIIDWDSKIFNWRVYHHIIHNPNFKLDYILSEEETMGLFAEFDRG